MGYRARSSKEIPYNKEQKHAIVPICTVCITPQRYTCPATTKQSSHIRQKKIETKRSEVPAFTYICHQISNGHVPLRNTKKKMELYYPRKLNFVETKEK